VVTLAETIVRNATETNNPLSEILVTTFGRDATAELKTRLKELLRHHVDNGGELPREEFRWIETESRIQTLDSFFADLL
jgi:ATP-dependent helicase/nuclease subunit A